MSDRIACSVLVLTRNSAESIGACLEALRDVAQVIVLDGGSIDGTREIALSFPNVTLRDQPLEHLDAQGRIRDFAAVRNVGLEAATQSWLFFVDADEVPTQELLASMRLAIASGAYDSYHVFRRLSSKLLNRPCMNFGSLPISYFQPLQLFLSLFMRRV